MSLLVFLDRATAAGEKPYDRRYYTSLAALARAIETRYAEENGGSVVTVTVFSDDAEELARVNVEELRKVVKKHSRGFTFSEESPGWKHTDYYRKHGTYHPDVVAYRKREAAAARAWRKKVLQELEAAVAAQ